MSILSKGNETKLLIVGGLVVAYGLYKVISVGQSVKEIITTDLNPASNENIVAKSVDSVVEKVTDGKQKTLGSALYCLFNSDSLICNPELVAIADAYGLTYFVTDAHGNKAINPQVIELYNQEKEFDNV